MTENQYHIDRCKKLIEEKLAWGHSSNWQAQNFDTLSELIFQETNVMLSVSTLKRIWGKVRYKSIPNLSTLNALARFAGYPNWRSLVNSSDSLDSSGKVALSKIKSTKKVWLFVSLMVVGILIGFMVQRKSSKQLFYNSIAFNSRPVSTGIPNTVIFKYDASQSNADSVFIQQNWDERRRVRVDKDRHEHASTYYLPGYYRAKLILNDSIVKEHDVFIESEDWMGILIKGSVPAYLPQSIYKHIGYLGIIQKDLKQDSSDYNLAAPEFLLTHVNKSLQVDSKNFLLTLGIQNTYNHPSTPCKHTKLMLLGTNGVIIIPLSKPGCVGELKLRIGEQLMEGSSTNLSAFGVDFSRSVSLKCMAASGRIKIELNNKTVYEGEFTKGIGEIIGVRASFQGTGNISSFVLRSFT